MTNAHAPAGSRTPSHRGTVGQRTAINHIGRSCSPMRKKRQPAIPPIRKNGSTSLMIEFAWVRFGTRIKPKRNEKHPHKEPTSYWCVFHTLPEDSSLAARKSQTSPKMASGRSEAWLGFSLCCILVRYMTCVDPFSKAEGPKPHCSINATGLDEFDGFRRFPAGTFSCTLCQDDLCFITLNAGHSLFIAQSAKFDLVRF
ncbi:hypothetical protein DFH06DRAFT_1145899 [Mycena polygramma]|nr:hypothetical protein DFH06DRAFT_1145899 [Mycena polygramma]